MKRILFFFICAVLALPLSAQQPATPVQNVHHVATALNHLTVLEFHEPVTMAAAGSSDFQIERQDSRVFVKPMKMGISTDLLVWTASRRFAYELETTEEVKNMSVAIDAAVPTQPPVISTSADELADVMLTRAFLGAIEIRNIGRTQRDEIVVRVEQVFKTRTTTYVHYRIENNTEAVIRLSAPSVFELKPQHSAVSLGSLIHKQLDSGLIKKLGATNQSVLPVARMEVESDTVAAGRAAEGVVAIRQDLKSPTVINLVFDTGAKATFVL
jgi:hypothetical protein